MAKKRRLRKGRIAAALFVLAAICVGIYFLIKGIIYGIGWIKGDAATDSKKEKKEVVVTPEMKACDDAMMNKLDSIMHVPMRLDTSLIAISVYDATTQTQVYGFHADKAMIPASCMKIATAIAAIKGLGWDYTYNTSLQVRGEMKADTLVGTLMLQADDDPLFTDFTPLIRQMTSKGFRHFRGNVIVSLAREDTLKAHPSGKIWDISYNKAPLLMKGKPRVTRTFMAALRYNGVTVVNDPHVNSATAKGSLGGGKYHYVARVSTKLTDILTPMLIHSSNIKAESVFYHLDWAKRLLPQRQMNWNQKHYTEIFWEPILHSKDSDKMDYTRSTTPMLAYKDGSGLSPENRLTANSLVDMLRYAWDDGKLKDYFVKEAFASPCSDERRGSLMSRMARPEFKDRIFVKTGTMVTKGGSSLAGYLIGADKHWYIFSIINNDSPVAESRIFQDMICKRMMRGK